MNYLVTVAIFIGIQAIAANGLNVIVGYAGQISLGHAAFFGIGAYASALLTTKAGMTFWQALPFVLLITGSIGLLLGMPSLRLREDFLAVTTIGINFIVESIFQYIPFFGGALGISNIPSIRLFGTRLRGWPFLGVVAFFLLLSLLANRKFTKSCAGLACFAIREEETAAASMGVSPVRFKLLAFVIGTAMAGIAGALYAHTMRFIAATDFGFPHSVNFMSMVVLGGIGTLWGPTLGAIILGLLPEIFRPLIQYRMLINALILLLMIRFQPGGILGGSSVLARLFRRRPSHG
ncbi:MAG: branched-chain amino acid ABC transporter permease [Rectinemataceae bacterium]|nr:branched-chain amino acid ABC transporter permease [Spirochaetaceae bacterium]